MTPVRKLFGLIAYLMLPDYILDPKVGGAIALNLCFVILIKSEAHFNFWGGLIEAAELSVRYVF